MAISFDNALGIHAQALKFRAHRAEVLSNNLANADTPNFKARDVDFNRVFKNASAQSSRSLDTSGQDLILQSTHNNHLSATSSVGRMDAELLYRTPLQPSIDGNTVEEQVEHAEYMKNSLQFQTSFTILNGKFKGLQKAIRGD